MELGQVIAEVRKESGLSLRATAIVAETSHSTLSAYEQRRVDPSAGVINRVANSLGFDLDCRVSGRVRSSGGLDRGKELELVLDLADEFPKKAPANLDGPVLVRQ